jgi:hypothetical protein
VAPTLTAAVVGETVTVVTTGGGGGVDVTVIVAVPLTPDEAAAIVAEPAAIPLTTPLELTVAAAALSVDHAIVCPVMTLPCWSFTAADRVVVVPVWMEADGGETVTVVTTWGGAVTVTTDVPVFPALAALIVAEPAATPVTIPAALTVAAMALLVDHATDWSLIGLPNWSSTVAANNLVAPTWSDAVAGDTAMVVTTGVGGGSVVTLVPPPEHTASGGNRKSQAQRPKVREIEKDLFCTRRVSYCRNKTTFESGVLGNKTPPRHRHTYRIRWRLGWRGDNRYSPVALRHRLSAVLL